MNEYYKEIKRLCAQYGLTITDKSIYTQKLFGKSGTYAPIYEPTYLSDVEPWAERVLNRLRGDIDYALSKGRNFRLKLNTYDDIDVRTSILTLSECYGRRTVTIDITMI